MTRLYGWLAGIVAVLAVIGVIYGKGQLDQRHASEVVRLKTDLRTAEMVIEAERNARRLDAARVVEQARHRVELQSRLSELNDYVETLEDRNRQCLSGADVERLRHLWK